MMTVTILYNAGFTSWRNLYILLEKNCNGSKINDVSQCGICWPVLAVDLLYYYISDFLPVFITILIVVPNPNKKVVKDYYKPL